MSSTDPSRGQDAGSPKTGRAVARKAGLDGTARETDRGRIARRLHDEVQQLLFGIRLKSSIVRSCVAQADPDALAADLLEIEHWAAEAIATVQELHADLCAPERRTESRGVE